MNRAAAGTVTADDPERLYSVRVDGSRNAIHPADVKGRFVRARRLVGVALMIVYLALPFVRIGGHPAVHLDVPGRRFFVLGAAYNAQDVWLVVFLLAAFGFGLLFLTAWLGRVWCGWGCPQTVFLEGVYRRIERFIDGPRERRLRLQAAPASPGKVARATGKQAAFFVTSAVLAHAALAYFVPVGELAGMVRDGPAAHPVTFAWAAALTGLVHFNFAWFREQMCIAICPYGRLQSVLHDEQSLVIGYDRARGEPRGKLGRGRAGAEAYGACIDCRRCVTACPTGIDIRNGVQLECVGCAQCIDACDDVMAKIGRDKGLVRYDSAQGFAGRPRRVLRPRLVAYGALFGAALVAAVATATTLRDPFEANLLRARGVPYVLEGETVRNQLELHLVNKHPEAASYRITASAPAPAQVVVAQPEVRLESMQSLRLPIFVTVDAAAARGVEVTVEVTDVAGGRTRRLRMPFAAPR